MKDRSRGGGCYLVSFTVDLSRTATARRRLGLQQQGRSWVSAIGVASAAVVPLHSGSLVEARARVQQGSQVGLVGCSFCRTGGVLLLFPSTYAVAYG